MGQDISQTHFSSHDFEQFSAKLHDNLKALSRVITQPGFGGEGHRLGAELELYIVDAKGKPLLLNQALKGSLQDPLVTLELNRYNLEYNFEVIPLTDRPFTHLQNQINESIARLNQAASPQQGYVLPVGILPTLTEADLGESVMTPLSRYKALSEIMLAMRGGEFEINIEGEEQVHLHRRDLTVEGACTSFQVHYSFPLENFVNIWNAMTLVTPLVLAISSNSPFLLGRALWHETRIPLFKQATDSRRKDVPWHDLPRVELGYDWLRCSAYELFAQRVYLYPPLIPQCYDEDSLAIVANNGIPQLHELNLHNGTIWHWNRPIYSGDGAGHIRIEMRSLPAGPTAVDMVANAAFHIGLAVGLQDDIEALIPAIPFRFVSENFYQAAKKGMNARLIWPSLQQNRLWDQPVQHIGLSLLDTAHKGLVDIGVDRDEATQMMEVIRHRLEQGQNGAVWQLENLQRLKSRMGSTRALQTLVAAYRQLSEENQPVSRWEPL